MPALCECERRGTDDARVTSERCANDSSTFRRFVERSFPDFAAGRFDEQVPAVGRSATDHYHFRIQDVDQSRESDSKVRPGPSKNFAAQWIAIDPVLIDR